VKVKSSEHDLKVRAVVFDLDGVIRDWDVDDQSDVEVRHGLPVGSILNAAMTGSSIADVTTGVISDEQWREGLAADLARRYGDSALAAVAEWSEQRGAVKRDVLDYAQELRSNLTIAILTNNSSRLVQDLEVLELTESFDYVFNSAQIGVAKPHQDVYVHVSRQLGLTFQEWLFVDDSLENVQGARSVGVRAHHFSNLVELRTWVEAQMTRS
jgi:putative hydrolase of the HAD superfamily